jgi:hypothetical protein
MSLQIKYYGNYNAYIINTIKLKIVFYLNSDNMVNHLYIFSSMVTLDTTCRNYKYTDKNIHTHIIQKIFILIHIIQKSLLSYM